MKTLIVALMLCLVSCRAVPKAKTQFFITYFQTLEYSKESVSTKNGNIIGVTMLLKTNAPYNEELARHVINRVHKDVMADIYIIKINFSDLEIMLVGARKTVFRMVLPKPLIPSDEKKAIPIPVPPRKAC